MQTLDIMKIMQLLCASSVVANVSQSILQAASQNNYIFPVNNEAQSHNDTWPWNFKLHYTCTAVILCQCITILLTWADDTICLARRRGRCSICLTRSSGSAYAMCCRLRYPARCNCLARPCHETTQSRLLRTAISKQSSTLCHSNSTVNSSCFLYV